MLKYWFSQTDLSQGNAEMFLDFLMIANGKILFRRKYVKYGEVIIIQQVLQGNANPSAVNLDTKVLILVRKYSETTGLVFKVILIDVTKNLKF